MSSDSANSLETNKLNNIAYFRLLIILLHRALVTALQHTFWVLVIVTMIISWSNSQDTCSTLILPNSLVIHRCLAALKGKHNRAKYTVVKMQVQRASHNSSFKAVISNSLKYQICYPFPVNEWCFQFIQIWIIYCNTVFVGRYCFYCEFFNSVFLSLQRSSTFCADTRHGICD